MRTGRVAVLVLGCLSALTGFALLTAAVFLGWAYFMQRDGGHFTSPREHFETSESALVSEKVDLFEGADLPEGFSTEDLGRVLLRATATDPSQEIFIGIGPRDEVDKYFTDVARTEVTDVHFDPFRPTYRQIPGTRPAEAPGAQSFWSTSSAGPGTQEVRWELQQGAWTAVVMNADAAPGVSADIQAGARLAFLGPLALSVLIGAVVFLIIGIPLIVAGAIGLGRHGPPQPHPVGRDAADDTFAGDVTHPQVPWTVYPTRLVGELDEPLSRWLWLVKWLLAIPHYFVLFFLGVAFVVTTLVSGFVILFTARYPRALFDFGVGVLRWWWRVQFYTYSALATDRYPPFTLKRTDYPADFDVDYPVRLSRGLVLVKWWLLAIPHYLILSLLAGGWFGSWRAGAFATDGAHYGQTWLFGSLLGLVVTFSAIALLFTGRYPHGLFDFVMGINRWAFRVAAYATLMRDEYPPFRLDQGPFEPDEPRPHSGGDDSGADTSPERPRP
ncbi:DUF4389 domain-containing protein [Rhodococcus opacus]|uniref:DUF4389 domain-containing protein n=1 Tax=Rhodococcus opacus TaxID=37919 RepID=UPI0006BB488B|nr:DUF4389 domain-containing protein [Rhodococcus opacus]QZS56358.1 DUF4389 domain-containing protein [Rhodococcus opacus]RKM77004.1 DUF4389 domain-containing protein [Rhodococcus opacus]